MQKWYETTLFYDSISGKYITSSMETIDKIVREINYYAWVFKALPRYVDRVNELRDEIGLDPLPEYASTLCNKPDGSFLEVRFTPVLIYGHNCLVLDFCTIYQN